jgi:hypothetical protein
MADEGHAIVTPFALGVGYSSIEAKHIPLERCDASLVGDRTPCLESNPEGRWLLSWPRPYLRLHMSVPPLAERD